MADQKLSQLTTVTPASGDLLYLVDVSDTTDGPAGSSKKTTVGGVLALVPPPTVTASTTTTLTGLLTGDGTAVSAVKSPVYHADAYGMATGNTAAQNSTALQAALDAAAVTGGTVFIPPAATHYLLNSVTLPAGGNVGIVGGSAGNQTKSDLYPSGGGFAGTVLRSGSAVPMFVFDGGSGNPVNAAGMKISDLVLDGNSVGTIGLDWTRAAYFDVRRVTVRRFVTACVKLTGSLVGSFHDCWFGETAGRGVWAIQTPSGTTIKTNVIGFHHCRFQYCTTWGVDWSGGNQVMFAESDFELNGNVGTPGSGALKFEANTEGVGFTVSGCWFEANFGQASIWLTDALGDCWSEVRNTVFYERSFLPVTYVIQVGGAGVGVNHLTVSNCKLDKTTAGPIRLDGANAVLHQGQGYWSIDNNGGQFLPAWPPSPNAFSFTDNLTATAGAVTASNTITLAGDSGNADTWPVTVDGAAGSPQVQVNGGDWTAGRVPAAQARNGDTLAVRMTASGTGGVQRTATVRVGGRSTVWTLAPQSLPADIFPTGLVLDFAVGPTWCFTDSGGTVPAADGDSVYVWKDRSGTYTFSQATSGQRPTLRLVSGKYVLRFVQASSQFMSLTTTAPTGRNAAGVVIALAVKINSGTAFSVPFMFSSGSVNNLQRTDPLTPNGASGWYVQGRRTDSDSFVFASGGSAVASNTNYRMVTNNDYTAGTSTGYVNNVSTAVASGLTTGLSTNSDSLRIYAGATVAGSSYFDGDIAAIVVANVAADSTQRGQLDSYLGGSLP